MNTIQKTSKHGKPLSKHAQKTTPADKSKSTSDNNNHLVEDRRIDQTPFYARRRDDKWFVTIGDHKTPHILVSYEECVELVKNPDWYLIISVMESVINVVSTIKKQ